MVWSNVLTIILKLHPLEEVTPAAKKDGKRRKMEECRRISALCPTCPALNLQFLTVRRDYYAGGDEGCEDGRMVGGLYLRDASFSVGDPAEDAFRAQRFIVDSPCGVGVVRDGVGVVRVRVKETGGWRTAFEQAGINDCDDEERLRGQRSSGRRAHTRGFTSGPT